MNETDASTIVEWVKGGGKLLLLTNDSGNCDLEHTNILARKLGFEFNYDSENHVSGKKYEQGAIFIESGNEIFRKTNKIYIKEFSTINVLDKTKFRTVLTQNGKNVMVIGKIGKGAVFAVGDPWLYNEYMDGRKLPKEYQNYIAGKELIDWISSQ